MELGRLKKAKYNIIVLAINQVVVFICSLILPRFILVSFGSEYNGIISSITQFLNFISILRLGIAGATRVELYKSLGKNDIEKTSQIVKATEKFLRKVGIIFLVYLLSLAIMYPIIIETTYNWLEISSLVIIIGIGTFAEYFFGMTYQTLLAADQKIYIYNIIHIVSTILNTLIACILIKLGFSIQIVKLGSALVFTMTPIILNIYVSKKYKLNKKCEADNTALKKRGDVVAHSIANIIHDNTDIVVLTIFCDVKLVSVYSVYNYIGNGIKQLMTIFTSGLEAAFGDMWVKEEYDKFRKSLEFYEYFIGIFVSLIFSCAFLLILDFVKLYTKKVTDIEYVLPIYAILVLFTQIFYCLRTPYVTIVQAAGKYKETRNGAFLEAGLNLIISVILILLGFNIYGVVIGTLVANIFRTIQYSFFISKNLINRKIIYVFKNLIWIFFNISLICGISSLIVKININDWKGWIICGMIYVIISIIVITISSCIFYRDKFLRLLKTGIKIKK